MHTGEVYGGQPESPSFRRAMLSGGAAKPIRGRQYRKEGARRPEWDSVIPRLNAMLKKSQGVFQDLAQLADLGCPHRLLLGRRRQILVQASFEIPFEQLHALFHADFLRAPAPGLVHLFEMNHLSHK